ncbi:HTH-type transcriptional regulator LeuO [Vibrio stylophorae]|uniref:HTH-type transcriptional regulator LeuO n=1 Tax=Vibrio stylophorae TaxID=659351 RepID=A0ABM8ZQ80_9VIBR|nr:transcriptional regulator LeuO [Vibrio stylophorae]CAH0532445.1 HTH-type transcriptional regulator LeuO [Vibrio stylophorae]
MTERLVASNRNEQPMETVLRHVDLNLLTVFAAVMQEQNMTRAAVRLGMSQPAVSNAVARLKNMFDDELFVRSGRGIQPTLRAQHLFTPLRQALQLVQNELPEASFCPHSSQRTFGVAMASPLDLRLGPSLSQLVTEQGEGIKLAMTNPLNMDVAAELSQQTIDFYIGYQHLPTSEFEAELLFCDQLVAVTKAQRYAPEVELTPQLIRQSPHAKLAMGYELESILDIFYQRHPVAEVAYTGYSCSDLLYMVSQSNLITVLPSWLAQRYAQRWPLKIHSLPFFEQGFDAFINWHCGRSNDQGHQWLKNLILSTYQ